VFVLADAISSFIYESISRERQLSVYGTLDALGSIPVAGNGGHKQLCNL